jgi:hypothetical protein
VACWAIEMTRLPLSRLTMTVNAFLPHDARGHFGVVFRVGVPDFACEQREFHGLHHHRYRFSRGIVSQTGLGSGSNQKGH